jgi:phospholipid/cholesterol/gamma-HCH transport system substrate-binding protein
MSTIISWSANILMPQQPRANTGTPSDASAVIGFSARILARNERLVASRVFLHSRKLDKVDPLSAVAAFNEAFDSIATELITWTADAL